MPVRARDLPAPVWAAVDAADVVVHAGDWVSVDLLDALERARRAAASACGATTTAPALRERLPEVARVELDGVRLAVVHETGAGRRAGSGGAPPRYPDVDVLVFGHSHIPWDTTAPVGCGCSTPARRPTGAGSRRTRG